MRHQTILAAEYIRMSTDQQDLSVSIQRRAILEYAEARGLRVIRSYEDQGRSGLTLKQRGGMKRLLEDVTQDSCAFSVVLVYDVSRWGRFQDTDASAYYEYHCRLHGIDVVYVKEPFGAEPSPVAALIKSIKRVMAAEYSRELGIKVRAGQDRAIELGFQMGATPLGLVRAAVSKDRANMRILAPHERKALQSDRIKWVHGPEHEVEMVRRMFELYTAPRNCLLDVKRQLEAEGWVGRNGRPLCYETIKKLLRCEAFVGNFVWGQYTRAHQRRKESDPAFVRAVGTIEPIISQKLWGQAQTKRGKAPDRHYRDRASLLEELRSALAVNPYLRQVHLASHGCANVARYKQEFGSWQEAKRLVGMERQESERRLTHLRRRGWRLGKAILRDVRELLETTGTVVRLTDRPRALIFSHGRLLIKLAWPHRGPQGLAWCFEGKKLKAGTTLLARMNADETVLDFVLLDEEQSSRFPRWSHEDLEHFDRIRSGDQLLGALANLRR